MKKAWIIIFVLSFGSCDQPDECTENVITPVYFPADRSMGACNATKNGVGFLAGASGEKTASLFSLHIKTVDRHFNPKEHLLMKDIPLAPGQYFLKDLTTEYVIYDRAGQNVVSRYELLGIPSEQTIEVLGVEDDNNQIWGTFKATFVYNGPQPKYYPTDPDTIVFKNADYRTSLK